MNTNELTVSMPMRAWREHEAGMVARDKQYKELRDTTTRLTIALCLLRGIKPGTIVQWGEEMDQVYEFGAGTVEVLGNFDNFDSRAWPIEEIVKVQTDEHRIMGYRHFETRQITMMCSCGWQSAAYNGNSGEVAPLQNQEYEAWKAEMSAAHLADVERAKLTP